MCVKGFDHPCLGREESRSAGAERGPEARTLPHVSSIGFMGLRAYGFTRFYGDGFMG